MGEYITMSQIKEAEQIIKAHFPSYDALRQVKLLRNEIEGQEMHTPARLREPMADYLETLYEAEQVEGQSFADADTNLHVKYKLTPFERLKAFITGKYKAQVDMFIDQGLAMGFDWQTEDIIETIKEESQ